MAVLSWKFPRVFDIVQNETWRFWFFVTRMNNTKKILRYSANFIQQGIFTEDDLLFIGEAGFQFQN